MKHRDTLAVRPLRGLLPLQAGPLLTLMMAVTALPWPGLDAHPLTPYSRWGLFCVTNLPWHLGNVMNRKVFPARDSAISNIITPPNLLSVVYLPVGPLWQPASH